MPLDADLQRDKARLDWMESHPFIAYRYRDPDSGSLYDHFTLVLEDSTPRVGIVENTLRVGIVENTLREAIDVAMGRR